MKKLYLLSFAAVAALMLFSACGKEDVQNPVQDPEEVNPVAEKVTISVSLPDEDLTKVTLTQDAENKKVLKLAWEYTDELDINGNTFKVKEGSISLDGKSAEFEGTATPDGSGKYTITYSNLPGGYAEQTQSKDGDATHLGYEVSISGADSYTGITFSEDGATAVGGTFSQSSILRLRAKLPDAVASVVQKVIFKASEAVFAGSKELAVNLTTHGAGDDKTLDVYATLPAGDAKNAAAMDLLIQFQTSANAYDKYTAYRQIPANTNFGTPQYIGIDCSNIDKYAGKDDDGTAEKPYRIGDMYQLNKMRDELESGKRVYFKMVDDVDLTGIVAWEPVNSTNDYQIFFEGSGHCISNMTITDHSNTYTGFIGLLYGVVQNVTFDHASVNGGDKNSGIVIGRSGTGAHAADLINVIVRNSTIESSNGYLGGIAGYIKKSNEFTNCHVIGSSITSTNTSPFAGGLIGQLIPNGKCVVTNCSAEGITITPSSTNDNAGIGGLIGNISSSVDIVRSFTTGSVSPDKSHRSPNTGGLVGSITGTNTTAIIDSYSSCSIVGGYTNNGGLIGKCDSDVTLVVTNCFASGPFSYAYGYGAKGGLIGAIKGDGVTVSKCAAWNSVIKGPTGANCYSSGAIVGNTHPNCVLTDNYRNPGMTYAIYWAPSAEFDHENVNGTTTPLKRITDAKDESALVDGTAEDFALDANKQYWAYHGKHCSGTLSALASGTLGWSSEVWDFTQDTPRLKWTL